jgi:hypothetical protein
VLALAAASAGILCWFRDLKGSTAVAEAEVARAASEAKSGPTWSERCRLALRLSTIAVLNLVIAGAANIAFVVFIVGNYSSAEKALATVALGLYKTVWSFLLPRIIDSGALRLGVDTAVEEQSKFLKAGDLFRSLLQIINFVVMPAVAVAVSDPTCFKHSFVAASPISSTYSSPFRQEIKTKNGNVYIEGGTVTSAFTPAFSYNYECTGTLVEKFAPVFAQVALTSAFAIPLLAAGARSALNLRQGCHGLRGVLLAMLPSLLLYRKSERDEPGSFQFLRPKTFIKADEVLRQTVSDLALMLSVGLVAPLLGVMFAASIISRCLMWEYLIDRFLSLPDEHLEGDVQALEAQCLKIGSMGRTPLYNARWLLVIFPSLFLALFVADIAGDAAGIESVLWAPILMTLLPPVMLFALTRLIPKGNTLRPTEDGSDARISFVPSEMAEAPVAGNPLHKSALSPSLELVELGDHIPEPTQGFSGSMGQQPTIYSTKLDHPIVQELHSRL